MPAAQHLVPVHVLSSQHGWPVPPHVAVEPARQTRPALGDWPEASQVAVRQQPPPRHVLEAQQSCPTPPQAVQAPPVQTVFPVHAAPSATHWPLLGSQQPPRSHVLPAQHTWPGAPQATHAPGTHTVLAVEQAAPLATHEAPSQHPAGQLVALQMQPVRLQL